MPIKPHRAPIFKDLYPTPASYEEARKQYRTVLTLVEELVAAGAEHSHEESAAAEPSLTDVVGFKILPKPFGVSGRMIGSQVPIVPEATGTISRIMLTVPKFLGEDGQPLKFRYARYADHFSRLLEVFGKDVTWVIVASEREKEEVKKWLAKANIPDTDAYVRHVASPRFNYSIWAQDPFVVLGDASRLLLCEGVLFNREEDMTIADDVVVQVKDISAAQSYLFFQGGNMLGGTTKTLIGADYIQLNAGRFGVSTLQRVLDGFELLTGTTIVPLGGLDSGEDHWHRDGILSGYGFQPIFHIDMYVTPTGVMNKNGKEIVFLSRPREAFKLVGKYSEVPYLNNAAIDEFFDETHDQLADHFEVRELPLLSTRGDLGGREEFTRNYFLTWGNALVEAGKRRVVLPSFVRHAKTFGLDEDIRRDLQQHVELAWKDLGFRVDVVDGLEDLAWGDGSIHCTAKVIARSEAVAVPS